MNYRGLPAIIIFAAGLWFLFSKFIPFTAPRTTMPLNRKLDLLTATAGDLRRLLEVGEYTSVELVKLYLA
jgi:hypothetical protein